MMGLPFGFFAGGGLCMLVRTEQKRLGSNKKSMAHPLWLCVRAC